MKQPRTSRPSSSGRLSTSGGGHLVQQSSTIQGHRYDSSFGSSNHYPTKQPFSSLQESSAEDDLHAASVHPLDQRHRIDNSRRSFSMLGGDEPAYDRSPGPPSISGRRRPMRDKSPGQESQAYKHSKFSFTSNGNYQSSAFTKDSTLAQNLVIAPQASHVEGTESTVSTTAPSTFWDELDDLKSRIRKLELTGKLPSSSNAAMSNVFSERPPTATTTVTTLSSSPNRFQQDSVSPEASTIKGAEVANIHPLLHSALAKTKPLIKAKLYKSLQATASDALTLAAMLCTTDSHEQPHTDSVVGSSGGINKQLHSNVNNMCRSLTQLCIALAENAENEPESSRSRPVSKNLVLGPQRSEAALQDQRLLRAASDEPELRSSSRVISRLEARRTSLLGSSPSYGQRQSPHQAATPAQPMPPVTSRLDRTASVLLRNRTNDGQMDSMNSRRPPSRAATEVGQIRMSAQTRASREYTSQHPGPNQADWSPSIPSSLPTRRNYFATGSQSPITPNLQAGTRRYLDFSTPPSSADSARFAEARQRRIASLGQHTSAGHSRIGIASGRLRQAEAEQQR